jgi:hypothetical protein
LSPASPYTISLCLEGTEADDQNVRLDDFVFQLKALQDALTCIDREVNDGVTLYYRLIGLKHDSPATVKVLPVLKPQFKKPKNRSKYLNSVENVHHRFFRSLDAIRFRSQRIDDTNEETVESFSELISGLGTAFSGGSIFNQSASIPLDAELHDNIDKLVKPGFISRGSVVGNLLSISFARGNRFYLYPDVGPVSIACHFPENMERKAKACIKRKVRVFGQKAFRANTGMPFRVDVQEIEEISVPRAFVQLAKKRRIHKGKPAHESIAEMRNEW